MLGGLVSMKDLHPLEGNLGCICFALNILVPPLGTFIHAYYGPRPQLGFAIGVLQILFVYFLLIGYIWSVIYGYWIYKNSINYALNKEGAF